MNITELFGSYRVDGIDGIYTTINKRTWVQIYFRRADDKLVWVGNASIGTYDPPITNKQCKSQIIEQIKKHAEKLHESTL